MNNFLLNQMDQFMLNPVNEVENLIDMYNTGKNSLIKNNAVTGIIGVFSEKSLSKHNIQTIIGLSDIEAPPSNFEITSGSVITAVYNNSLKTEMFTMILNSALGVNDSIIVLQYNDALPDLDQILFVKNQEMVLLEEIKIKLKPNDCIVVAFGKTQEDGKPLKVGIKTIGKNLIKRTPCGVKSVSESTKEGVSDARKGVFIGLMIILAIAIGVLIYSITNPPTAGFRRRR
jgi:hypothetical protein